MPDAVFVEFFKWIVTTCTVGYFLTGFSICRKVYVKGNSQDTPFLPLICMFCSSTLWFKYGLLKSDQVLALTNCIGFLLGFCYITFYFFHTPQKSLLYRHLLFAAFILFPILIYIKYYASIKDEAIQMLGTVASTFSVINVASPLSAVFVVIRTKSTECMPFPLSLANFIVCAEWTAYGYMLNDTYVITPNALGTVLSAIQLLLFMMYPSSRRVTTIIVE